MKRLSLFIKKKIFLSRKHGILFYIKSMHEAHDKIKKLMFLIKNASNRGPCVWCEVSVSRKQICYLTCKTCREFKQNEPLHGRCVTYEGSCSDCNMEEYLKSMRRVQ